MKYYNLLFIALLLSVSSGCGCNNSTSTAKEKEFSKADFVTSHFNITIASDLSNRLNPSLYPKAISDFEIVNVLIDNIYPRILTHRRAMNQLDQFRMDFINKKQITAYNVNTDVLAIDFAKFKSNQQQRISYLRSGFENDKTIFKQEFKKTYNRVLTNHSIPFS